MFAATADQRYLRDLNRLCDTFVTRTFDPQTGCWLEAFDASWRPNLARMHGLVIYGHLIEAAAFLSSIAAFTGNETHLPARAAISWATRCGMHGTRRTAAFTFSAAGRRPGRHRQDVVGPVRGLERALDGLSSDWRPAVPRLAA